MFLFVYGTLLEPKIQKDILGREIKGDVDVLLDYRLDEKSFGPERYPVIYSSEGSIVPGAILEINTDEIKKIDYYETDEYFREVVTLKSGREAWVYKPEWPGKNLCRNLFLRLVNVMKNNLTLFSISYFDVLSTSLFHHIY